MTVEITKINDQRDIYENAVSAIDNAVTEKLGGKKATAAGMTQVRAEQQAAV